MTSLNKITLNATGRPPQKKQRSVLENQQQIRVTDQVRKYYFGSGISNLKELEGTVQNSKFSFGLAPNGHNYLFYLISLIRALEKKNIIRRSALERSHNCSNVYFIAQSIKSRKEIMRILSYLKDNARPLFFQKGSVHHCHLDQNELLDVFQYSCFNHALIFKPTKERFMSKTDVGNTAFGLLFIDHNPNFKQKYKMINMGLNLCVDVNEVHLNHFDQTLLTLSVLNLEHETIKCLFDQGYLIKKLDEKVMELIEKYVISEYSRENPFRKYPLCLLNFDNAQGPEFHEKVLNVARVLLSQGLRFSKSFTYQEDRGHLQDTNLTSNDRIVLKQKLLELQNEFDVTFRVHLKNYLPEPLVKIVGAYFEGIY